MAVKARGRSVIHNAACEPHVSGLARLLKAMGAKISGIGTNRLEIEGVSSLRGAEHRIGSDFMEIGSFLYLGAIGGGKVVVEETEVEDLRFILKTFARMGIHVETSAQGLIVDGTKRPKISREISGRMPTLYSGPWPAYPTDLMSVAIVAATQAEGTVLFFEKMFESRMFFTDRLVEMGAQLVLCDPHRVVVSGHSPLYGTKMSSPDIRAGMALLMAALIAQGKSEIENIHQIERGFASIDQKLQSLGAAIQRKE
jgi:UDP-N-acetylglucosamine 1-carboxyvinyltransferase